MWKVLRDHSWRVETLRLRFFAGDDILSCGEFLHNLTSDTSFRELLQDEFRNAPYVAFRWETPPLTSTTIGQPFECLLHDSPGLNVRADPTPFENYFQPGREVVSFNNLGADAVLIVPCPISRSANYCHLGAFHRSAPVAQQHTFWIEVARTVMARLGSRPLWLSTAGGGVDWLHMRVDDRPKYYRHLPWREWHQNR